MESISNIKPDIKMLDEKNHLDEKTGCLCRYVRSETEYFRPHYHNYYELFLTLRGEGIHIINDKKQKLLPGQLLFIRDFDVHDYVKSPGKNFEFLNLAFSKNTLEMMFEYLGEGYPAENLLRAELPPTIFLTEREKEKLFYSLSELTRQDDKKLTELKMRTILVEVFTKYFFNYKEEISEIPFWLELTYEKMKKPENFVAGTERMLEISGKSREHLARSMRKYYDITPSEYVTELRLNHCAGLLLSSNFSVTDICYECGFENISWFYKRFCDKFGVSPGKYREINTNRP